MNNLDKQSILRRPFASVPNPEFLYRAGTMERALQETARCIERIEGVACIIGNSGLGKSMACQALYEQFHGVIHVVHLNSARLCTRRALLQNILFELGLPYRGMEEGELRLSLAEFLRTEEICPQGVLLLVDEAHTLPSRLLEEIRLLTNQVVAERVGIRLVLAGTSRLEERLATAPFESLNQRIVTRCYLEPLTAEETRNYIRHQLDVVHSRHFPSFREDALQAVYTATGGVPRLINQLCDHVLVLADANGLESVEPSTVEEAWADLQQLPAPWHMDSHPAKVSSESSTVIEFGELDDPAEDAIPMPVTESFSDASTNSNEYASRINPLLESDDNDLLDEHFAPRSRGASSEQTSDDRPTTIPFTGPAEQEPTDSGAVPGPASSGAADSEYTLQPTFDDQTRIHGVGEGHPPVSLEDLSDFSDGNDFSMERESEALTEPLPPLVDSARDHLEPFDLEGISSRLTTDQESWGADNVAHSVDELSNEERDLLAPIEDHDAELELPEVEDDWPHSTIGQSHSPSNPPSQADYESWLSNESTPEVSFFETTEPTAAPLDWASDPSTSKPFAASDEFISNNNDASENTADWQEDATDGDTDLDSLYAALEADAEIEHDPEFEFVQGVDINLPINSTNSDETSDPFESTEVEPLESTLALGRDDSAEETLEPETEAANEEELPAPAAASNPFDEAFEEELEVEPLYSSALDQNRSSLPSSWARDTNDQFDEQVKSLEPVSNDPSEIFPLSVNVRASRGVTAPEEVDEQQAFNPFATERKAADEEPTVSEFNERASQSAFNPQRYPAIADSVFEQRAPQESTEDRTEPLTPGLSLHRESATDEADDSATDQSPTIDSLSDLAANVGDELDIHASLEESRYSNADEANAIDDDDLDERILREIVSFRDVTSFDPSLDPVMPEFRPNSDAVGDENPPSSSSNTDNYRKSDREQTIEHDLPEIVLVDPVVPTDPQESSQDQHREPTGHRPNEDEDQPAGKAHREDYRSLFDRLKGQ